MARQRRPQRIVDSDDESDPSPKSESSADSSSEEEKDERNDFIDLEAADEDDGDSTSSDGNGPDYTFHHFSKLPPELRDRIWEFFCPDLTAPSRVLRLGMELDYDEDLHEATGHFWDGPHLESQTETFRCLSSVHRESRQRALKFAPDEIILGGHSAEAVIRVNGAKDILCMNYIHFSPRIEHSSQWQPECGGPIQNIAIASKEFQGMGNNGGLKPFQLLFPKLKVIYNLSDEISLNDRWLRWCLTEYAHKYYHERIEDLGPIPQVLPNLLCYPDTERYPDFAKYSLRGLAMNLIDQTILDEMVESDIVLRPMVSFLNESGIERFEELEQSKPLPLPELPTEWPSDAEEEALVADQDAEDGYESEGINDEELSEDDLSSEDENIPRAISPGSDGEDHISISSSSDHEATAANLSSIEASEDEEPPTAGNVQRKRRIVSDSDEDEDNAESRPEAHQGPSRSKRRRIARTLQSDSETETGDVNQPSRAVAQQESVSDDDSSESSSSEESEAAPRAMSLAQRLRQQQPARRQRRRIDSDAEEEDDDDEDDMSSADDDEGDERPRRGGAFFLDEASEEEEDDEEEEEEDSEMD